MSDGTQLHSVLAFAGDIIMLSPFIRGLKGLLSICAEYAFDNDLEFNVDKSVAIWFSSH